jgi:dihydropyrimidinase
MRTVITNATVVRASGSSKSDVVVIDGVISEVVARPSGATVHESDTVIDATGLLLVPGGVDAHVHMQLDVGFTSSSDSFESGTIAAAIGGTTTIVDFAEQRAGGNVLQAFEQRFSEAESQCVIDWGLHQVLGGVNEQALIDTRSLIEREGVSSIKLFMAYPGRLYSDDGQLLRALQMCADTGMMAMVHAENGLAIDVLVEQAVAAGNITPDFHSRTRPPELEAEAGERLSTSFTCRVRMLLQKSELRVVAARMFLPRRVRSICTCRWKNTLAKAGQRERGTSVRLRFVRVMNLIMQIYGKDCETMSWQLSVQTTVRSVCVNRN